MCFLTSGNKRLKPLRASHKYIWAEGDMNTHDSQYNFGYPNPVRSNYEGPASYRVTIHNL